MNTQHLITMLNQMGDFFISQPDQQQAQHDLAEHVRLFWEPRMRTAIFDFLDAHPNGLLPHSEAQLAPIVLTALQHHREQLLPPPDVKSQ